MKFKTNKINWTHGQLVKVNHVKPIENCPYVQFAPDAYTPAGTLMRIFETHDAISGIPYADVYDVDGDGLEYNNYIDLRYLTLVEE